MLQSYSTGLHQKQRHYEKNARGNNYTYIGGNRADQLMQCGNRRRGENDGIQSIKMEDQELESRKKRGKPHKNQDDEAQYIQIVYGWNTLLEQIY